MRKISLKQAYYIGQQDAMYGLSLSDNPWKADDERHCQWMEGWHNPRDHHLVAKQDTNDTNAFYDGEM